MSFAIMIEALTHMLSPLRVRTWNVRSGLGHESVRCILARFNRFETVRWRVVDGTIASDGGMKAALRLSLDRCWNLRVVEIENRSQMVAAETLNLFHFLVVPPIDSSRHARLTELWIDEGLDLDYVREVGPLAKWERLSHLTRLRLPKLDVRDKQLIPMLAQCKRLHTLWLDLIDRGGPELKEDLLHPHLVALVHAPLVTLTLRLRGFHKSLTEAAVRSLVPLLVTLTSLTIVCRHVTEPMWSDKTMAAFATEVMPHLDTFRQFPPVQLPDWFQRSTMDVGVDIDMNGTGPPVTDLTLLSQWLQCHPRSTFVGLPDPADIKITG